MQLRFALELTADEAAFGFDVLEHVSGDQVVMLRLDGGLRAIKIRTDDGKIVYAVCDEKLHPLYPVASTLDDLRTRFRAGR